MPAINAATDLQLWNDTFDAPGVLYAAFPYTSDPQTLINDYGLTAGCASSTVVPYADGVFTGSWAQWTDCGPGGAAEWHLIVASPADQAFTAFVEIQLTGPQDQQAFDVVLETFNVTPTATWPASPTTTPTDRRRPHRPPTTAPAPTTTAPAPTTAAPGSTVFVPPPPATNVAATTSTPSVPTTAAPSTTASPTVGTPLVDETNFLTITVPADWTDQNLDFSRHDDGSPRATITAAPNLQQFYDTWDGPGTHVIALPPTTDLAAMLAALRLSERMHRRWHHAVRRRPLRRPATALADCDGKTTRVVNVAARPADNSFTLFVQVQQTSPDDAVLDQILGSAGVVPGAVYPTPAAEPPLTPTGPVPAELLSAPATPLTTVTDSRGRISVGVPSTWIDTDIAAQMNDDGSDRPRVAAAPVLDDFYTEWEVPGAQVVAYPFASDPSTLLQQPRLRRSVHRRRRAGVRQRDVHRADADVDGLRRHGLAQRAARHQPDGPVGHRVHRGPAARCRQHSPAGGAVLAASRMRRRRLGGADRRGVRRRWPWRPRRHLPRPAANRPSRRRPPLRWSRRPTFPTTSSCPPATRRSSTPPATSASPCPSTGTTSTSLPIAFEGSEVPWINAGDQPRASGTRRSTHQGCSTRAFPFDADVETVYERFELTSGCSALEVVPYDDGAFSGQWWQHTQCGPERAAEWHAIVASPASEDATVVVIVQLATAADRPALDVVLQSFNFTPTATWPTATIATTTTTSTTSTTTSTTSTTTSTVAPTTSTTTETSTSAAPGTRYIVDDTDLLSVTVPGGWTDVTTASGANDDGTDRPTIVAAPDAREFLGGFDVPGTRIFALPPDVEPATVLANNAYSDNCSSRRHRTLRQRTLRRPGRGLDRLRRRRHQPHGRCRPPAGQLVHDPR